VDGSRSQVFARVSIPEGYERFTLRQLFEPWAGSWSGAPSCSRGSVLDVASGLGPVARLAAAALGPDGRVVASDISAPMLALAAGRPRSEGWATIEFLVGQPYFVMWT
jgi:ubiquinone/menaquinone biosynthesis C-methylase UbiE